MTDQEIKNLWEQLSHVLDNELSPEQVQRVITKIMPVIELNHAELTDLQPSDSKPVDGTSEASKAQESATTGEITKGGEL